MRKPILLIALLLGCASPSLEFRGSASKSLTVGGDEITVFFRAERAQAVRTNFRRRKQQKDALFRLVQAIEIVTMCKVRQATIKGDIVLITASLRCPKDP